MYGHLYEEGKRGKKASDLFYSGALGIHASMYICPESPSCQLDVKRGRIVRRVMEVLQIPCGDIWCHINPKNSFRSEINY